MPDDRPPRHGGGTSPLRQEAPFVRGTVARWGRNDGYLVGGEAVELQPPVITNPVPITHSGTIGVNMIPTFTIQASNSPTSRNAANLPAGLSVNTNTGVISGTPTPGVAMPGPHNVTLTASNAAGPSEPRTLVLTLAPQPVPSVSAASITHPEGTAWTHQIVATNLPILSYSISGQPAGVTVNTETGLISGTAAVPHGVHEITMHATNHGGPSAGATLTVTIEEHVEPVGWEISYSYDGTAVIDGMTVGTGRIPFASWTGWDDAFHADLTDEILYTGPDRPLNADQQRVRMFAQWLPDAATPPAEVEVPFDMWPGEPAGNFIHAWGVDRHNLPHGFYIVGSNATSSRIALRVVKEV